MIELTFEFVLDQEVETPFGDRGIVTLLGYDDGGNCYYVKTGRDSQWYKEKQLKPNGLSCDQ